MLAQLASSAHMHFCNLTPEEFFFPPPLKYIFITIYIFLCMLQCVVPEAAGKEATGWFLRGFPALLLSDTCAEVALLLTFRVQGYTACQSSCCTLRTDTISKEAYAKQTHT